MTGMKDPECRSHGIKGGLATTKFPVRLERAAQRYAALQIMAFAINISWHCGGPFKKFIQIVLFYVYFSETLHLAGNYSAVEYESRASWYYGRGEIHQMEDTDGVIADFLEQLDTAEFMFRSSVPLEDGQSSIFDTEIYHLYFKMNNGTTVRLRLCENGYVFYQGILPVCVRVPKESYDALLGLLGN